MRKVRRHLARLWRGDLRRWLASQDLTRDLIAAWCRWTEAAQIRGQQPREVHRSARPLERFDLHALRKRSAEEVRAALADFRPAAVPLPSEQHARLIVSSSAPESISAALRELPANWTVTFDRQSASWVLRPLYRLRNDHVLTSKALEVQVQFVTARSAISTNGVLDSGPTSTEGENLAGFPSGEGGPTSNPPIDHLQHSVDIVYTWVNGADPEWQQRRDDAWEQQSPPTKRTTYAPPLHWTATDESRYVSTEELRYSMRSVFQYANWVRRIFIVTDGQVPYWLDTSHPKVQVVDHHDLLPGGSVFNSHAIESALHRIPGLAERYLYLNDDVFFGRMAYPTDFFHANGIAKFFPSDLPIDPGSPNAQDLPIMAAAKNGRDLMARRFGLTVSTKIRHTVHPQLRSVIEQMEEENPAEFDRVGRSLFRSPQDLSVAASLHHWYAYALGKSVPAEPNYLYLNITSPRAGQVLDALASLQRYDTFCLNQEETTSNSGRARRELRRFFPKYFPLPAPWEKPDH